jgi:hypothetical protein
MKKWERLLIYLLIGILIAICIYLAFYKQTEGFVVDEKVLVTGQAFHDLCKYNLDDRYPLKPYDSLLQEGDRVFLKVKDITNFVMHPPPKKVTVVIANNDETFNDHYMNLVKPYATAVYAVNSSAKGAIQIPMGFRDSQYTPHKVMIDIEGEPSQERDTLCLVNFLMATTNLRVTVEESRGERQRALDAFTGKDWVTISDYVKYDFSKSMDHSAEETKQKRVDYYRSLKRTKCVICPPGAGMDTHRVYESLFFGCIPVIKTSFLDPMYNKLGGCWIVNDWSEVTQEECERHWQEKQSNTLLDANKWLQHELQHNPPIVFISYANDKFRLAGERIQREANEMGIFSQVKIYNPNDIDSQFKDSLQNVMNRNRGGGYWLWKPYIVNDMLSKVKENDIVVYVDAGCKLQKENVQRLKEYIDMVGPSTGKSVFAMRLLEHPEYAWTVQPIFDYFDVDEEDEAYSSVQIVTGVHIYRKCDESVNMVKKWLEVATTRPDLFTDDHNDETKKVNSRFNENRHDQSIFSVILKTEPYKSTAVIIDQEIEPGDNGDSKKVILAKRLRS